MNGNRVKCHKYTITNYFDTHRPRVRMPSSPPCSVGENIQLSCMQMNDDYIVCFLKIIGHHVKIHHDTIDTEIMTPDIHRPRVRFPSFRLYPVGENPNPIEFHGSSW